MAMRAFCRRQIQYAALRQARNGSPKTSVMRNASVNAVVSRTAAMSVAPSSVVAGKPALRGRKGAGAGRARAQREREWGRESTRAGATGAKRGGQAQRMHGNALAARA